MASGVGAQLHDETDPLAREDWLVVADQGGDKANVRAYLAAPVSKALLIGVLGDSIGGLGEGGVRRGAVPGLTASTYQ